MLRYEKIFKNIYMQIKKIIGKDLDPNEEKIQMGSGCRPDLGIRVALGLVVILGTLVASSHRLLSLNVNKILDRHVSFLCLFAKF